MTQGNQANQAASNRRYWDSHELRRLRAAVRIGSMSPPAANKERKAILREFATILKQRKATR